MANSFCRLMAADYYQGRLISRPAARPNFDCPLQRDQAQLSNLSNFYRFSIFNYVNT